MKHNPITMALLILCAIAAALYIGRYAMPEAGIYGSMFSTRVLMIIGGWTKLAALVFAAVFAFRSAFAIGKGNPARSPWLVLAAGLTSYSFGQSTLVAYQTATGVSPFPSIADVWFVAAYPLMIISLVMFTFAYAHSGFPMSGLLPAALGTALIAGGIAWPLLQPVLRTPAAPLALALNLAYPILDLLLLIPSVVLLTLTVRFRGGAVWRIWAAILAGIVFTVIGDICFAWFSGVGYQGIDPVVHAMYIIGYASLALGTSVQYQLLAPDRPAGALATAA